MIGAGLGILPATEDGARLQGLKARMAFILGVVLIPALLYSCWQAIAAYRERHAQQAMTVANTLRVIATYENEFFERTRILLLQLSAEPAIGAMRGSACAERLLEARNRSPDYLNFAVIDPSGIVPCSTAPELMIPMAERPFFRQLREGASFVVSDVMPRRTGPGETIVVAAAIHAVGTGAFAGAVAAAINLQSFQGALDSIDLPAGGIAYLADGRGRLLVEPASAEGGVSGAPDPALIERLLASQGIGVAARGSDGVDRDYRIVQIGGRDLYVVAAMPTLARFAWLQHDLVIGVFAPTLMLGLAVIAIWIATDYLVIRHVRTLAIAARAYSRGDLDLRLDLAAAPAEFRELALTLARMGSQVRRREEELRASLAQKDLLLREIHHRVKNNLQIVTSLLNLRAQRLQAPAARDAVRQAQMRIAAMTLVHRKLYETDDVQEIELAGLLADLCNMIEDTSDPGSGGVELEVKAEPVQVPPDQAIPLALLTTEALSNAFKHAFPEDHPGRIEVALTRTEQVARLAIADNGVGLAGGSDVAGMGVTLMRMLAKQVGGTLRLVEAEGTQLEIEFPLSAPVRHRPQPETASTG